MIRTIRLVGVVVTLFAAVGSARADTFYVVVFGAESKPPRPKYPPSWAAFVRLPGCDAGETLPPTVGPPEVVTISWLPCGVELPPNRLFPEPGRNFDLHPTFQI